MKDFGESLLVDVAAVSEERCEDLSFCIHFVKDLCDAIHMERHGDPTVEHFGHGALAGWTVVQLITTSCVVAHFMDSGALHLDICSCGAFSSCDVVSFITKKLGSGVRVRARHCVRREPPQETGYSSASSTPLLSRYDHIAAGYDRFYSDPLCVREDDIVAREIRHTVADRVIDLGCGSGAGHRIISAALGRPPERYLGIDCSGRMLDLFWTKSGAWRWSADGSMYWKDLVQGFDTTIELRRQSILDPSWVLGHRGEFEVALSLWSLSYLSAAQLRWLAVRLKWCVESEGCWFAVIYGHSFPSSRRYLPPGPDEFGVELVNYTHPEHVVRSILDSGAWKLEWIRGLTGPFQRWSPACLLPVAGFFDRAFSGWKYSPFWSCHFVKFVVRR